MLEVSYILSRQETAYIQKRTKRLFGLSPRLKPQKLGVFLRSANNSSVTLKNAPIPVKIGQIKYPVINRLVEFIKISKLLWGSEILKFASSNNLNSGSKLKPV